MSETLGPGPTTGQGQTTGSASHLPWHLIPSFEPGETELAEYTKRLEFLAGIWPAEFLNQLAPRAALQCKGSAFQKVVRIPTEKLKVNDLTGVQLLVTTLGGVWGKTTLEDKYEKFERAIYGVSQRSDESNESYVARHEILFEDVVAQGASLSDMRAYILLRNSALSPEDKKRVVIEAKGNLKYETVIQAIRMLGAKFFHEVQGQQKSYRSKTYDVNHVQEIEEEACVSEDYVYLTESNELPESIVEQFLNEGDEDALVVQQFEDALIDTVQNDTEMTAYMNAYVEARRKLTEKSKSRGFWPIRSKGFGKKGKAKGQAFRSRKPLALRIAESDCRLCGQRGHWRAECPRRHAMGGSATNLPPKTQPTNVLVSVNDVSEDEADVFMMEAVESSASDVHASEPCQDPHDHDCKSHSHECFVVFGHKQGKARHKGEYYNQVFKRLSELLKEQKPANCRRKSDPIEVGTTPSLKDTRSESFACSEQTHKPVCQSSAEVSPMVPQEISPQTPEQALFATSLTLGILDLGASQTVMGQHQLPEFLSHLPPQVRSLVHEKPVEMSFRFGNNSVVPCKRAIFVPIDKFWIKIAIVESKTPFLISNNVCRCLGAVIDTNNQSIWFRQLDCELPLQLSGKKLFLLDLCELAAKKPPRTPSVLERSASKAERVFSCLESESERSRETIESDDKIQSHSSQINHNHGCTKLQQSHEHADEENVHNQTCTPIMSSATTIKCHMNEQVLAEAKHHPPAIDQPEILPSESTCHVRDEPCGALQRSEPGPGSEGTLPQVAEHEPGATGHNDHQVRRYQGRSDLSDSSHRRSKVLPVVPSQVCDQRKDRACGVHLLSVPMSGSQRTGIGRQRQDTDCQGDAQGQDWNGKWESCENFDGMYRLGRGGGVMGSSAGIDNIDQGRAKCTATRSDRECPCPSDAAAASSDRQTGVTSRQETALIEQSIHEFNQYVLHLGMASDDDQDEMEINNVNHNVILQEMTQFGHAHGFLDSHGKMIKDFSPIIDVLEVYCSADSQLTHQCRLQGLKSVRFGLKEGDLGTWEGRQKLYHVLFYHGPRHVWMSPRCRAWCKWSQFNASKSAESARRVMLARSDDEVHLLLCEAVFLHQCQMGTAFHFHLEQPRGSEMLYEQPLRTIVESTNKIECDMCSAGKLKHPVSHLPMQKSMNILSTSQLMDQGLSQFKCHRNHEHAQVAGSCRLPDGSYSQVSAYTELYTRVFGQRVARIILASKKTHEKNLETACPAFHGVKHGKDVPHDDVSEPKRRRLSSKTTNPPAYPEAAQPAVSTSSPFVQPGLETVAQDAKQNHQDLLELGLKIAPRVGKVVIERGDLFEKVQQAYPTYRVRVIELCKGTDRFRKPPVRLARHEAPWRLSLGLLRHDMQSTENGSWMQWENLSNRQLCAKSPPMRLMLTVFASKEVNELKRPIDDIITDQNHTDMSKQARMTPSENAIPMSSQGDSRLPLDAKPRMEGDDDRHMPKDIDEESKSRVTPKVFHGPKFLQLDKVTRQWLSKVHHNLGHPSSVKLQLVLKQQGYSPEILQGVGDFHCSTCHELQEPRIARPAALSEVREFNDCVGCDLITWTAKTGKTHQCIHFVDSATNFQLAMPVFQTDATALWEACHDCWFRWAGPSKQLIMDNASALCSDQFAQLAQRENIHLRVVAPYAHWQLGKTERHGDILQDMLQKMDHESSLDSAEQFKLALHQCCSAKNALARSKGYTPEILVLGKSRALPGGLCEDPYQPANHLADSDTPEGIQFRQHLLLRESARTAFVQADNSEKLRRAFLRRQRPHRGRYASGTLVMFWRPGRGEAPGQWHGPARTIIHESDHVVWLSHSSRVFRVAPEHVRCLSEREAVMSGSQIDAGTMDVPFKDHGRGVFQFEDLTGPAIVNIPDEETTININNPGHILPLTNPTDRPSSDLQPDSEPGAIPTDVNSNAYTPPTPLSDQPQENLSEDVELEPKDIPIPSDSSDDGLMVEDYWIQQKNKLIRVHQTPRKQAFNPIMAMDCPVNILHLSDERYTAGNAHDQALWAKQDVWDLNDSNWQSEKAWTGVTIFFHR